MYQLTNEKISKKFKNNFDMVNYAIKIAEDLEEDHKQQPLRKILNELEKLPDLEKST